MPVEKPHRFVMLLVTLCTGARTDRASLYISKVLLVRLCTEAGRGLASPCISVALLIMLCARDRETWQVLVSVALSAMLCTEAGRPGRSLYLCGVVGHAMYRGRETWQVLVSLWCCWSCYVQRQGEAEKVHAVLSCCWSCCVQETSWLILAVLWWSWSH